MRGSTRVMGGNPGLWHVLKDVLGLVKAHLSLYISITAVAGHVLFRDGVGPQALWVGTCVLVLSFGAACLNNIQDRRFDRLTPRTCHRILARGDLAPGAACALSLCLMAAGLGGLFLGGSTRWPLYLGGLGIFFYNGMYTPLKQAGHGRWAMVPGVLSGMIPPAIGWSFAGPIMGNDVLGLVILMAGLGVWQVPHFLLVGEGLPGLFNPHKALVRAMGGSLLFSVTLVGFLLAGGIRSVLFSVLLVGVAAGLPLFLFCLPRGLGREEAFFWGFRAMNLAMLAFLGIIVFDRIF